MPAQWEWSAGERRRQGATLWLTGLSAAGKTTIARMLECRLEDCGRRAVVLDGDELRRGLSADLGLAPADRREQARRTAHVAALLSGAGLVAVVALISPYAEDRALARAIHEAALLDFHEVWIDTPLRVCEQRDPKGIYQRARAGSAHGVTGVDAPYECPSNPDVHLAADTLSPAAAAAQILTATGLAIATEYPQGVSLRS